jgi:hypothetical protein
MAEWIFSTSGFGVQAAPGGSTWVVIEADPEAEPELEIGIG